MLTHEQNQLALSLLNDRPTVLPNTRVIIDSVQRKAWFDKVCAAMTAAGIADDADIVAFCDTAGVPD